MKTSTVEIVKLEPSEGMRLKNKVTSEVYESFIFLAKSLSVEDFEEISEEEYQRIIEEREEEVENGEE